MIRLFKVVSCILFLTVACMSKKNKTSKSFFNSDRDLYNKLIEYQKLYPIPITEKNDVGLYVYVLSFFQQGNDTIVIIKRSSSGCYLSNWDVISGVYSDTNLLPTILRDSSILLSHSFVNTYLFDSVSLNKTVPNPNVDYPESFPPVYKYMIKGDNLILQSIDTAWGKWR